MFLSANQAACEVLSTCFPFVTRTRVAFRCTNGDFYVALGSSMGLALSVWVGSGLLKRVLYFFGDEPSLGRKSPILHLTHALLRMESR